LGIPERKIVFIPLGINIDDFRSRDKEKIRIEYGIKEEIILLFVGNLVINKGLQYLLEAFSKLLKKKNSPSIRLVIIGDGPYRKNLVKQMKSLRIEHAVSFAGRQFGENLYKWYSIADIFLLPSMREGRPTVINEAMASECAVIATNVGGIPEQIQHESNGLLIEPRSPEQILMSLHYLVDRPDEIIRMGKNGRRRIIEKGWTWKDYATKVNAVYREIC
jgi:glycosyltransferase involved in cell wall biosynthesis